MRIRWKILALLLAISIVPMLVLRCNATRIFRALAADLSERSGEAMIRQSTQALKRLVEDHARVLQREGELVAMVLETQSAEIEKRLGSPEAPAGAGPPVVDWRHGNLADREPASYCRITGSGRCKPFVVSHLTPRWTVPQDAAAAGERILGRLEGMTTVYEAFDREFTGLFLWQMVVLENGIQAVYPGPSGDEIDDMRQTAWYRAAKAADDIRWHMPLVDPLTRQVVMPFTSPIHGPGEEFLGVSAAMVPVSTILHENDHIQMISEHVVSLLVRTEPRPEGDGHGILILASEDRDQAQYDRWRYLRTARWLSADAPEALAPVVSDLMKRRSGIAEVPYQGRMTLMAYSAISTSGTSLLLIVPRSDLIADAEGLEQYVQLRFIEEMRTTGMIFLTALALIALLSFLISRNVTKNIGKLLEGSRRLATGDFTARIDIHSRDEIGELGRAFNRMVPDLEERIRLKQGIEVARSVQQSLLPKAPPRIPGLDIAAESRYCDETGGDFFDFIDLDRGGRTGIGVAVGDVSGHGISAALLMATARAFLEGRVARSGPLGGMIADVNRLLCRDTDATGQFVTLFYMELEDGAAAVDWVRAGHDPALLYDPGEDAFTVLKGEGAALGIDADMAYTASTYSGLAPGQIIAVGTDGIWESRNSEGEMFGRERFKEAIRRRRDAAAREILDGVVADVDAFCGPVALADDITLVIVKIKNSTLESRSGAG